MKIYLAHNYAARTRLRDNIIPMIEAEGHTVTSTWITDDAHNATNKEDQQTSAVVDLEDIRRADVLILFSDNFGERPGKGKYVEFGFALHAGKRCIVVGGDMSCVFYHLPNVRNTQTIQDALRLVERW